MSQSAQTYHDYARLRNQLDQVLASLIQDFERLEGASRVEQLTKLRDTLKHETFKVIVLGEFKRGKSTLINALLGHNILPAKVAPCTAVITRVAFGDQKIARLHYKDGRPALEVSLEQHPSALKEHITIQMDGRDSDEESDNLFNASPFSSVEVLFPLDLCRNNVEIVDSPGLNEHQTRTAVTRSFLSEADAVVLVLACDQALSQSERRFIDSELNDHDLRDVFFIWNRFDAIRNSPDEIDSIQKISKARLESKIGGRARVFYVAAIDALRGRLSGDAAQLANSQITEFEAALEEFLATERGRVKLSHPIRAAENAIQEGILQLIPYRENLFNQPLEEIRKNYEVQRPRLDEAERQRERLLRSIERRGEVLVRQACAELRSLVSRIEASLPEKVRAVPLSIWQSIKSQKQAREKLAAPLDQWINEEVKSWSQKVLSPLISAEIDELQSDIDVQAATLLENLDDIQKSFTPQIERQARPQEQEVSGLSRVIGVGGGLLIGDVGTAMEGAAGGVRGMARGMGLNLATAFGMGIIWGSAAIPFVLPVLASLSVLRLIGGAKGAADKLRAEIVREYSDTVRAHFPEMETELRTHLEASIARIYQAVAGALNVKVDEVRGQVQAVIKEREEHEASAGQKLAELGGIREDLVLQARTISKIRAEIEA